MARESSPHEDGRAPANRERTAVFRAFYVTRAA